MKIHAFVRNLSRETIYLDSDLRTSTQIFMGNNELPMQQVTPFFSHRIFSRELQIPTIYSIKMSSQNTVRDFVGVLLGFSSWF